MKVRRAKKKRVWSENEKSEVKSHMKGRRVKNHMKVRRAKKKRGVWSYVRMRRVKGRRVSQRKVRRAEI